MTLASLPPSPQDTRVQTIAEALRQALRDGVYPCGERLIELTLARDLNVSQNTIREALRLLEQEGWVVHRSRQGVYVREFTADEAEEIYDLWALLGEQTMIYAARRWTRVELLTGVRPAMQDARERLIEGRWLAAWQALLHFHLTLATLAGRPQTAAILTRLINQVYLLEVEYEFNAPRSDTDRIRRLEAYEQLLGVIKFADSEASAAALAALIREEGKPVVRWLAMHR